MGSKTVSTQPVLNEKPTTLAFNPSQSAQQSLFAVTMVRPGVVPVTQMRRNTVCMSAQHGLNKNDKKFIREMNHKLYNEGTGENLSREDVANPNLRLTLQKMQGHKQLSKYQHAQIMEMSQKKQYARVEQLAEKFGLSSNDAKHLGAVSRAEGALGQY